METKEKIKNKYNEIEELRSRSNPHLLVPLCNQLLALIEELRSESDTEKDSLRIIIDDLSHTINKEAYFVSIAYSETRKKNAALKRQKEYEDSLDTAINQIYNDICILLN